MTTLLKNVDDTIGKCQELRVFITKGYEVTKSIAEECETDEKGTEIVNELRDMIVEYARMERDIEQYCSAAKSTMTKFNTEYAACQDEQKIPNLVEIFEETLQSIQVKNVEEELEKNKEVVDFTQTIWTMHHPDSKMVVENDDDEIQMTLPDDSHKFICPITKAELVDPVKSKLCGHTYSRKAVEAHIASMKSRANVRANCPIAGCVSTICETDLEANNVLAFELRQKKRK